MKFKGDATRFDAENALADIMTILRFLPRKLEIEQLGRERKASFWRSDFITDDNGLANVLSFFEGEVIKKVSKGTVHEMQMTANVKLDCLFSEIDSNERKRLVELIKNNIA